MIVYFYSKEYLSSYKDIGIYVTLPHTYMHAEMDKGLLSLDYVKSPEVK